MNTTQTIKLIETVVCEFYNIDKSVLSTKSRKRDEGILECQICHYLCKKFLGETTSNSVIGFYFGNKNCATVSHSKKVIDNLIETDKDFAQQILSIENQIKEQIMQKKLEINEQITSRINEKINSILSTEFLIELEKLLKKYM